ncbi:GGDEF domain-containing protein [Klebsiella aerogenes]
MGNKFGFTALVITSVKGYIWFLTLNILFSVWLMIRVYSDTIVTPHAEDYIVALYAVNGFALLNLCIAARPRGRVNEGRYPRFLPAIVLIFSLLWSLIFYHLLSDFSQPTVAMAMLVILLLPATITFYISVWLLMLFTLPVLATLFWAEMMLPQKFTLPQLIAALIILAVVLSARYILLEAWQKNQRSEYEKNLLIQKLMRLASYDPLTGLYNRHSLSDYFLKRTRQSEQSRGRLFLIVLDIDFFKQYNDRYGHVEGDKCLVHISRCIEHSLRKASDAAFRFGGEEFVMLAVCNNIAESIAIARRIQHAVRQAHIRHDASDVATCVTVSQGIAEWQTGMALEGLLECADKALYRAKREGRNRICQQHED